MAQKTLPPERLRFGHCGALYAVGEKKSGYRCSVLSRERFGLPDV